MKCLIIDDEQLARKLLEGYVEKIPHLENVKSCKSSLEAISYLQDEEIDLIFLDIQMPDLSGVEFLKTLEVKPLVIFTTAYKEYALEGYELDVTDYMLKPISFERFLKGVNKAHEQLKLRKSFRSGQTVISDSSNINTKDFIQLTADRKTYKVKIDDILYIEGLKEYVTFFTTANKIIVLKSLKELEETLPVNQFLRVHKSYIVNKYRVKSLYGNQLEIEDKKIPVGKTFIKEIKGKLFD